MGGQESKAKSKIVTEIITDVLIRDTLNCSQLIQQEQGLNISGSGNVIDGLSMKQAYYIHTECMQSIKRTTDIQNEIAQKIQQAAEAQGEVIVSALGRERSQVVSEIRNMISNTINKESITSCVSTINASQVVNVSGNNNIVKNVSMEQHTKMVRDCMQRLADKTNLVNKLDLEQTQTASAKEAGLFGWMQSGYGTIVLIAIVGLVFLYIFLKTGGSGPGRMRPQPMMRPRPMMGPSMQPPQFTRPSQFVQPSQFVPQQTNINPNVNNLGNTSNLGNVSNFSSSSSTSNTPTVSLSNEQRNALLASQQRVDNLSR